MFYLSIATWFIKACSTPSVRLCHEMLLQYMTSEWPFSVRAEFVVWLVLSV